MSELTRLSATELLAGYASRSFSPVEVLEAVARRLEAVEGVLRAFVTLALDEATAAAADSESRWLAGSQRPLEGVPLAVKDLFDTAGLRTTYGSPIFATHVPGEDAEAVRLATSAGAVVVGKTSTHEFAWGVTGINRHFDTGRNPWRLDRVAGGSSAGSAAAIAADIVPLALGSDTGGSIRIPAAFCGVVGLKPTYARISASGCFPLAPSLDHVGLLARTPADAQLALDVLQAAPGAPPRELRGLRVGISAGTAAVEPAPATARALADVHGVLVELGTDVVDVTFATDDAVSIHAPIQRSEALRTHREAGLWPARRSDYGEDVASRMTAAESLTFDAYVAATTARERLRAEFDSLFTVVDVLLTPVSPVAPPGFDAPEPPRFRDLVLPLTTPQNLAGLPACAVRAGFDEDGLPVGVQLTGARGDEATLLAVAQAFASATPDLQARRPTAVP